MADPTPGRVRTTAAYGLDAVPADGTALAWSTVARWLVDARNYWVASTRADALDLGIAAGQPAPPSSAS